MQYRLRLTELMIGIVALFALSSCGLSSKANSDSESISNSSQGSSVALTSSSSVEQNRSSDLSISSCSQSFVLSSQTQYSSSVGIVNYSSSTAIQSSSSVYFSSGARTIVFGTFIDARDNQSYKTVVIGTQTWMGNNLNYSGDLVNGSRSSTIGYCPHESGQLSYNTSHDDLPSCATYGRLYDWTTAMNGKASSQAVPSGVQGICPSEWHLPSLSEWMTLQNYSDLADDGLMNSTEGISLRDSIGWYEDYSTDKGMDVVGFSATPAGDFKGVQFYGKGFIGRLWLTTEYISQYTTEIGAYQVTMGVYNSSTTPYSISKDANLSIRCLHD